MKSNPNWIGRYTKLLAACTFFLVFAGAMVVGTDSGLSVPDWPLSFGRFFPPMTAGVFYEHGHRVIAGVVSLMTLGALLWVWLGRKEKLVRWLALAAFLAVLVQALLGGLTVLLRLPDPVVIAHASLAQAFFATVVVLAHFTSSSWEKHRGGEPLAKDRASRGLLLALVAAVYAQIVVGATMRHLGAALHFPYWIVPMDQPLAWEVKKMVLLNVAHTLLGAATVTALCLATAGRLLAKYRSVPYLRNPALLLLGALVVQVALGIATLATGIQPEVAALHVAGGAFLLGTSLVLALRGFQMLAAVSPAVEARPVPALKPAEAAS